MQKEPSPWVSEPIDNLRCISKLLYIPFFSHQKAYLQAHIPGARHFDLNVAMFPGEFERFSFYEPEIFQQYVQLLGVDSDNRIILYSRGICGGMLFASRAYWIFKVSVTPDVTIHWCSIHTLRILISVLRPRKHLNSQWWLRFLGRSWTWNRRVLRSPNIWEGKLDCNRPSPRKHHQFRRTNQEGFWRQRYIWKCRKLQHLWCPTSSSIW